MSCIEIYKIDTDGYSHYYDDVPNSWMGSMWVWRILNFCMVTFQQDVLL